MHKKRNSIIREAIKEWLVNHTKSQWPSSVSQFKGSNDFPDVQELRENMVINEKKLF